MDTFLQYAYNSLRAKLEAELNGIDDLVKNQRADLQTAMSLLFRTETHLNGGRDDDLLEDVKEFLYS